MDFKQAILPIMPLHSRLIKFIRLWTKTNILYVCLLVCVRLSILLRKLELYGITDRNYAWIISYLSNYLQNIQVDANCGLNTV